MVSAAGLKSCVPLRTLCGRRRRPKALAHSSISSLLRHSTAMSPQACPSLCALAMSSAIRSACARVLGRSMTIGSGPSRPQKLGRHRTRRLQDLPGVAVVDLEDRGAALGLYADALEAEGFAAALAVN